MFKIGQRLNTEDKRPREIYCSDMLILICDDPEFIKTNGFQEIVTLILAPILNDRQPDSLVLKVQMLV